MRPVFPDQIASPFELVQPLRHVVPMDACLLGQRGRLRESVPAMLVGVIQDRK